tara:strand:+ start:550 stop:903 length:354 start_codon:yes stop_codon:yes gene_type:complete
MSSRLSDADLILDSMGGFADGHNLHDDIIESERGSTYYEAKAINILKQFTQGGDEDDYFYFLKAILGNYRDLSKERQEEIKKCIGLEKEIIYKEKIVYKEKSVKGKKVKPKLIVDDY